MHSGSVQNNWPQTVVAGRSRSAARATVSGTVGNTIMRRQSLLLTLNLRTRAMLRPGNGPLEAVEHPGIFAPAATALLLCDMWDDHWCPSAARRGAALA